MPSRPMDPEIRAKAELQVMVREMLPEIGLKLIWLIRHPDLNEKARRKCRAMLGRVGTAIMEDLGITDDEDLEAALHRICDVRSRHRQ